MMITQQNLQALTPGDFERLVAHLLEAKGLRNVILLAGVGDEGIDIRAEGTSELVTGDVVPVLWAVQCKRYSSPISQEVVRTILNAAISPSKDLFTAPIDYFLLATTSFLSPSSRRLLDRANQDRGRYGGCRFLAWEGERIADFASKDSSVIERFFKAPAQQSASADQVMRLSVIVERTEGKVRLIFLSEYAEPAPVSRIDRTELSESDFNNLVRTALQLAGRILYERPIQHGKEILKEVGRRIADLIPPAVRKMLFESCEYIRLASNAHVIPFELAYDEQRDLFLGAAKRIGRIHFAEGSAPLAAWSGGSILLVGASQTSGPLLPAVNLELTETFDVLAAKGFDVTSLSGEAATVNRLRDALQSGGFKVIHFAGHGLTEVDGKLSLLLGDSPVGVKDLLANVHDGGLVFLNACGAGDVLDITSKDLINRGFNAVIGFVGPVTDDAGRLLATRFYEELTRGLTLGNAIHSARENQRSQLPDDPSWASLVLFGDPTMRFIREPRSPKAADSPSQADQPLRLFLCHASEDKPSVRQLFHRLRKDGFTPWLDDHDLLPGQEWEFEIKRAVRDCDAVLVCLSRASTTKSGFLQKEIRLALDLADEKPEGTSYLIPVKLEPCEVPDRLQRWQWVELYDDTGYDRLVTALRALRRKSDH